MATIPSITSWTNTTTFGDAADLQAISDAQNFLLNRPGAHLYNANGLTVTKAADSPTAFTANLVTWSHAYYQNDNNWADAANASTAADRLYVNTTGIYNITACAMWGSNTGQTVGGETYMLIARNKAGVLPGASDSNTIVHDQNCVPSNGWGGTSGAGLTFGVPPINHVDTQYRLTAGDYLQMWMGYGGASAAATRWVQGGSNQAIHFFYLSVQWEDN